MVDNWDKDISLLYLADRHSGIHFLVDCGITISIFPASLQDQKTRTQPTQPLAANSFHIATYRTWKICLDLGFQQMSWSFRLAAVTKPIRSIDFLSSEHLAVDFQWRTLDAILPYAGRMAGHATHENCAVLYVDTQNHNQWSWFFLNSQASLRPTSVRQSTSTVFSITSPPLALLHTCMPDVFPLSTYRCQEGLWGYGGRMYLLEIIQCIHPSPPYDKETRWFMEGDYQLLSASTTNERYPVPRIQDFNAILDGCTLFLKIDLWKGYHQFLVVAEDIHKMAVSTPFGLLEFVHMPFGLSNAGETFLRLMIISCEASPLHVCLPEWHTHCISQWGETCCPSQADVPSIGREWFGD